MKSSLKTQPLANDDIVILLIEDSMDDGVSIIKALVEGESYYNFKIIRKYTLDGGITTLKSTQVDVVLLDLGLPDARDTKSITEIHGLFPNLPIVIISGHSDIDTIQRALQNGAQEFLIKGEMSGVAIRQSMYQAIARKKIELAYHKGDKL